MLSFLDVGVHKDPNRRHKGVADVREFAELVRRLHVPHYDEARPHMAEADPAEWPADGNEVGIYSQSDLKRLIAGDFKQVE